ncbi:potassium voltage-gated channel subfamily A member 1-like [Montipora capricornis]|uniref:potassium voltage-gated channel subfamily A member 1-like n=1 Tax=Montipora capricornis TaxID=246305 RepID=UPI0035F15389
MNVSLTLPLCQSENKRISSIRPASAFFLDHKSDDRDDPATKQRIRINVRGSMFETFQSTLEQFPNTTLGCPTKRKEFYDPIEKHYCLDRDPAVFDSILFYYQSGGILARPESIPQGLFNEELEFFGIHTATKDGTIWTKKCKHEMSNSKNSDGPSILKITGNNNWEQRTVKFRKSLWLLMEYPKRSYAGKVWVKIFITVILLSVVAFSLETIPELNCSKNFTNNINITLFGELNSAGELFYDNCQENCTDDARSPACHAAVVWFLVETSFVMFFLVEYLMRIFAAPNRCDFILSLFGLVDALAIAPYFITVALYGWRSEIYHQVTSFSVLRTIRLFRVVRVFKLSRYSDGLRIVGKAFKGTWRMLLALFLSVLMTIAVFASFIIYVEGHGTVSTIMESSYFTVITMTTVGYGDVVPKTVIGKTLASACMLLGIILLFIMPLPVFVSHFNSLYEEHIIEEKRQQEIFARESPSLLEKLMAK